MEYPAKVNGIFYFFEIILYKGKKGKDKMSYKWRAKRRKSFAPYGGSRSKKLREKIEKFKGPVLKFLERITET
jgi:hypothetical protein